MAPPEAKLVLICGYNPHLVFTVNTLVAEGAWVTILAEEGGPESGRAGGGAVWTAMRRGAAEDQVSCGVGVGYTWDMGSHRG